MPAELNTRVQQPDTPNPIARLNDAFRRTGKGGTMVATAGVIHLAHDALPHILEEIKAFSAFTLDSDLYGEHDFGAFTWRGARLFWKIDCYDQRMRFASPDPADTAVTLRVMIIMLVSEY